MKNKKTPIRKCIGCGDSFPKQELIRVVSNKEGQVKVDLTGKANGRGAYICKTKQCLEEIKNKKKLANSLRCKINDDIYEEIETYVEEG